MMRGSRVTVPPLHNLADVLGLCLLLVVLFLVVRALTGNNPFQDLASLLSPPAMATLLVIEIELANGSGELAALLPVREKASRSAALSLAQRIGDALLGERDQWRFGALRAVRVKEDDGEAAWEAAWQQASADRGPDGNGDAPPAMVVTVLALITGRSLRMPKQVTADEIAHFVRGLGALDVRNLDAVGGMASPVSRAMEDAKAVGLVAL